jgi:hypothetical protein
LTTGDAVGFVVGFGVPLTGVGVGRPGVGVGPDVGFVVGVGLGVELGVGVGPATVGVGVGPSATIGPSLGALPEADGDADGSSALPVGDAVAVGATVGLAVGGAEALGFTGSGEAVDDGAGVRGSPATPWSGCVGATTPAVSATVARMRLRTPKATTRRAR